MQQSLTSARLPEAEESATQELVLFGFPQLSTGETKRLRRGNRIIRLKTSRNHSAAGRQIICTGKEKASHISLASLTLFLPEAQQLCFLNVAHLLAT